jgi:hypothetical protein
VEDKLEVLADTRRVLLLDGKTWFDRFSDLSHVLEILVREDENDTLFGIGAKWSPQRRLLIGRAAVATGQAGLGLRVLGEAEAKWPETQTIKRRMNNGLY